MTHKPVIADLFCGAGGAAMGLHRAGFEVVGFDIAPQPRYPFEFHLQDAFTVDLNPFDAVWASPPCQAHSVASIVHKNRGKQYVNHIPDTRVMLQKSGKPYIIENVPGAPLQDPVTLCGTMFGLGVFRHRLFESNILLFALKHLTHAGKIGDGKHFSVAGGAGRWKSWGTVYRDSPKGTAVQWREAMGIDWMNRKGLTQAIPPAYSEYLGKQLRQYL
ncbi:MAG: DNA cytosine methyltransferase [Chloroflexota bacterium]